jgi:hypothetical protein
MDYFPNTYVDADIYSPAGRIANPLICPENFLRENLEFLTTHSISAARRIIALRRGRHTTSKGIMASGTIVIQEAL